MRGNKEVNFNSLTLVVSGSDKFSCKTLPELSAKALEDFFK